MTTTNGIMRATRGPLRRRSVIVGAAAAGIRRRAVWPPIAGGNAEASPAGDDAQSWGAQHQVRDVTANLFEWNWPSVATECTTVLGPAGLRRRAGRAAGGLAQA